MIVFKRTENNEKTENNESDKTRSKQINLYFIRCSLHKNQDISIMQLGYMQKKKSKKDKVQKYVSLFQNKQFLMD